MVRFDRLESCVLEVALGSSQPNAETRALVIRAPTAQKEPDCGPQAHP